MRHLLTTVLLFAFVACERTAQARRVDSIASPPNTVTAAAPADSASAATADWQDPTCEVDTVTAHPDPRQLVHEYVARNDSLGFFAGGGDANDQWLLAAAECPGHLGGTDGAMVVQSDTITELRIGPDSAAFVIHYVALGSTTPNLPDERHMRFEPLLTDWQDTVRLVRTPYGWRISGAEIGDPAMGPEAVLRQSNLDSASVRALDSAGSAASHRRRGA